MDTIKIKDLIFRWDGQQQDLLKIEDLTIQKGDRVFLRGASGSGKSSFLSLLGGIITPQSGEIEIMGVLINKMRSHERDKFRANHIGYIFQLFNLVPYLSIIENVTLPCHFSKKRNKVLEASGSTAKKEAIRLLMHMGLLDEEKLSKPVGKLSVGQQQRVAACRALIGNPEIIMADEPTSSLDEDSQNAFIQLLLKECSANQTTLVFVSHDQRFSKLFDKSVLIDKGGLVHIERQSKVDVL